MFCRLPVPTLCTSSPFVIWSYHVLGVICSSDLSRLRSEINMFEINMFPAFVQHVSTGFANFDKFDWRWNVAAATYWLALARCGRSGPVQARHHSPPVSAQQSAKVRDRLLCRWSSQTVLSTPSPAGCTALSTNDTRPSDILCRWTNRLEFASRRVQR